MAGVMAISRDKMLSEINSIKYGAAADVAGKLDQLRRLRREFVDAGSEVVLELLSPVLNLLSDSSSPVRKYIIRMIAEIGQKHLELLPEIIPFLIDVLKDEAPAVSRQAILCATNIFRTCFIKIASQGLYSGEISETLKLTWEAVLKLKDELCSIAFRVGNEGRRICSLKFVESVVLLYTPDPDAPLEPISQENLDDFDISWLRGGHPILNVSDLSGEASQSLNQLLDLLRAPYLKFDSFLMFIVLIKSISILAKRRPAFYGRILPVLLAFKPSISASKALHVAGVHHALKNAFESCLDCAHHAAAPWRNRLATTLSLMKVGDFIEKPTTGIVETNDTETRGDDAHIAQAHKDEKSSTLVWSEHDSAGRKRTGSVDKSEFAADDKAAKRARSSLSPSEGLGKGMAEELERNLSKEKNPSHPNEDNGPVQQLVAMFGALAAQGEKAAASLEILISSISADLLAEVVMFNMQNIPPRSFKTEENETSLLYMGADVDVAQCDTHIKHLSMLLADALPQSVSFQEDSVIEHSHDSFPAKFEQSHGDELEGTLVDSSAAFSSFNFSSEQVEVPFHEYVSVGDVPNSMETDHAYTSDKANDSGDVPNVIPGLASSIQNEDAQEPASLDSFAVLDDSNLTDLISASQEDNPILGGKPVERHLLTSDMSEELSSRSIMDSTSVKLSGTSEGTVSQPMLPKISAPVLYLSDERKDQLQQLAFVHIINAYRQVSIAGGSEARFSILAHSGMEFPTELDPWKLLREHIFSDYSNHEGHELTLRALYRLYGEAEADRDFFSSTTATSVYETFLLQVADTLRDSFPPSDKSLGRLLCDVPYLPNSIFEMLESLSCPGNDEKELYGGDRVTQGLSVVWSLILQRPPIRGSCLKIALKSAVHCLEEIRMKAIRLIANKLYPMSSISGEIEDFAREKMVGCIREIGRPAEADKIHGELPESSSSAVKDISPDSHQLSASESTPSSTLAEVQQHMSLYFALCTKKHSLFWKVFDVYRGTSAAVKQAIHQQIPLLVRTLGSSPDLLNILSDPPTGSEGLIIQVVQTLTDGIIPSSELVLTIKKLYEKKLKDVDILIPILPFLSKDEVLALFPHLVSSPLDKFQVALSRVVQGFTQSAAVLTPAEALISIHGIDPERDGVPLKKVTDACNACFEQRLIFSQQVLAKVLNQLVEQIPLPLLFMRTVLQAVGAFPTLMEFIMEILSRLVSKQIWKYPKLWVGFLKCAQLTKPHSFSVLLQLPTAQLENALSRIAVIKDPLVAHAAQPHIRSSLPRSTLVVLGLETQVNTETTQTETENQTQTQIQTQTKTPGARDPDNEPVADSAHESSPGI